MPGQGSQVWSYLRYNNMLTLHMPGLRLKLESEDGFNMDKTQISWFASLVSFATIPTCLLGGFLGQYPLIRGRPDDLPWQGSIWAGG